MKELGAKIAAYCAKRLDLYRRRKHKVKVFARTRDNDGTLRDYDVVAIPQTLERKVYDVRIKRQKLGGMNTEILERQWTREFLEEFVHANS